MFSVGLRVLFGLFVQVSRLLIRGSGFLDLEHVVFLVSEVFALTVSIFLETWVLEFRAVRETPEAVTLSDLLI